MVVKTIAFLFGLTENDHVQGRDHVHAVFPPSQSAKEVGVIVVIHEAGVRSGWRDLKRKPSLPSLTIEPDEEAVARIETGRRGEELLHQVASDNLLSVPHAFLEQELPPEDPIARCEIGAIRNMWIADFIACPICRLHADFFQNSFLKIIERICILASLKHPIHDCANHVIVAVAVLEKYSWSCDKIDVLPYVRVEVRHP